MTDPLTVANTEKVKAHRGKLPFELGNMGVTAISRRKRGQSIHRFALRSPNSSQMTPLSRDLDENHEWLHETLGMSPDIVWREFLLGESRGLRVLLVYIDPIVDSTFISESVVARLLEPHPYPITVTNAATVVEQRLLSSTDIRRIEYLEDAAMSLLDGHAILLFAGCRKGLSIAASQVAKRAVEEPSTERAARGPREGFTENLMDNLSLLRGRLRSPALRLEFFEAGVHTRTRVVLSYLDGVIRPGLVEEARARLSRIGDNIDGILNSESITELIEDHPSSIVSTINATERPDRAAAAILEGRFVILVDGTPFALIGPTFFTDFFITTEDYTARVSVGTFTRLIRFAALFGALFLPSLYVALVSFHQEMIPTPLLLSIAAGREGIPFPAVVEALLMELAFEVLREAGLRLPSQIGNAISIVGVLVIGQAAVAAGIVSPIMIIVVGATAIATFAIPSISAANTLRLLRFPILIITGAFGALGIVVSFILLTLHVVSLRSFGLPIASPYAPFHWRDLRDTLIRAPRWARNWRPSPLATLNPRISRRGIRPTPPTEGGDNSDD